MTNALVPLPATDLSDAANLNPSGLGELDTLPLVPQEILRRHNVLVKTDTRFRAAARLMQSLWREDRDLPCGFVLDGNGRRQKMGPRISLAAGESGSNFLDQQIFDVVRRAQIYCEIGALLEPFRLRSNLLSSTALCFNAFAPLQRNLLLASRFVDTLVPGLMSEVVDIKFEHSPGRGRARFSGDHTAIDVAFRGRNSVGQRILLAVEVKYSEAGEQAWAELSPRHDELVRSSNNFCDPDHPALFAAPHAQLTRLTNLVQSMVDADLYDAACFILAAPRHNHQVQFAAESFAALLNEPGPGRVRFLNVELEHVWAVLSEIGQREHARKLHRRYTDFWCVDGELGLPDINDVDASLAAPQA